LAKFSAQLFIFLSEGQKNKMAAINISNLSKKFGDFSAVSDLSFSVTENHIVGFLGPNGAGKTTTIRMLIGLSKPTSGQIEIAGKEITFGDSSSNHLFGYLPEQPSFYGWMTGREYLNFAGESFGLQLAERKNRINELLDLVDLKEAGKKRIVTYSNGMKQRLGIAQALINKPKVLIMDEPVSALDPIGRREVLSIIGKLKKEMTIFLSTHILSDVDRICDDIVMINKGKLVTTSSLPDLKSKYAAEVLEVEFESDPETIINVLEKESWAKKIKKDGTTLRIWLDDENAIRANQPLKFFANCNIGIIRYGLTLPDIEDIFVALLEGK